MIGFHLAGDRVNHPLENVGVAGTVVLDLLFFSSETSNFLRLRLVFI
jgi:hypothetical protein